MSDQGNGFKLSKGMIATIGVLMCCTFALLIWRQLRMVTGVPRTAYADPHENIVTPKPKPGAESTPPAPAQKKPSRTQKTLENAQEQGEKPGEPSSAD